MRHIFGTGEVGMAMHSEVNSSFAAALRCGTSKEWPGELRTYLNELDDDKIVFHQMSKAAGSFCAMQRQGPQARFEAGFDVIWVERSSFDCSHNCFVQAVDKQGECIPRERTQLLLHVTEHAVESIFQSLRTASRDGVLEEVNAVAPWLAENRHLVATEESGLLLTTHGVFLLTRGAGFLEANLDARYHWDATTWISESALEDHAVNELGRAEVAWRARLDRVPGEQNDDRPRPDRINRTFADPYAKRDRDFTDRS